MSSSGGSQTLRRSAVVASGTLLSRITGLLRVAVTVAVLGDTLFGDAYNSSNAAPNIVYELLIGGVFTATLVPLFTRAHEENDERAVQSIFSTAFLALAALTVIAILAAPAISTLFAAKVTGASRDVTIATGTLLIRWFMPQILFYGFTALATAALNARRRFVAAAYAPVLNNVVVITVMFIARSQAPTCAANDRRCLVEYAADHHGFVRLLGLGTTFGIVAMASALVIPLRRLHRPLVSLTPTWRHPAIRQLVRMSAWTIGYVVANQLALVYITRLARETTGALVQYQTAFMFFQLPHGLLAVSIMTALAPEFASAARNTESEAFAQRFREGLRYLVLMMIPASALLVALAPAVANLLRHGAFTTAAVWSTSRALAGMAAGLSAFSVYLYTLRGFYAFGDTRTPFAINCAENAINVVLAAVLYPYLGVGGLGLAYAGAYVCASIGALMLLHQRHGPLELAALTPLAGRVTLAAAIGGTAGALVLADRWANVMWGLAASTVAIVVMLGASRLFHIAEITDGLAALRTRRRRRV